MSIQYESTQLDIQQQRIRAYDGTEYKQPDIQLTTYNMITIEQVVCNRDTICPGRLEHVPTALPNTTTEAGAGRTMQAAGQTPSPGMFHIAAPYIKESLFSRAAASPGRR